MEPKIPPRHRLLQRWSALKTERGSWLSQWQDISTFLLPRNGRFFLQDHNRGERKHNSIYDSTGTRALRTLAAGLMAGATSPARRWFKLRTPDKDLNQFPAVKIWLDDATQLMESVFQKSNTYRALHQMYNEIGAFGTASSIIIPDFESVIHHYVLTVGEYCIATNERGEADTLYRHCEYTVAQLVKKFGYENCSDNVKQLHNSGALETWIPVIHAIEPREDRDPGKKDNQNMAWASYYFEESARSDKYLRVSGFRRFPAVCPRWDVTGGDIYGTGPGMEALGDVKQLQHQQLRKAQVIDYQTRPPLALPNSMKNHEVDTLPGGISYYDQNTPVGAIRSMFEANLDLNYLLADIQDVRGRINSSFFVDVFLMLANSNDTRKTATEVAELHEEKMVVLGPVLERLHTELYSPLIEITFDQMMRAGVFPQVPEEMRGMEVDVEFVSILAQAQRAIGANSVDRFMGNIGAIAQYQPNILDKIDTDYYADSYADMIGVDPRLLLSDEEVAAVRQQRAEAQAAAEQAAMAEQESKTISNLAGASMGPDSVLPNIMDGLTGYGTPGVIQ